MEIEFEDAASMFKKEEKRRVEKRKEEREWLWNSGRYEKEKKKEQILPPDILCFNCATPCMVVSD